MHQQSQSEPPNIADAFADLLSALPKSRARGLVIRLAHGFYDGWRPDPNEVADLVAVELGILTWDECLERKRKRRHSIYVSDVIQPLRASPPGVRRSWTGEQ